MSTSFPQVRHIVTFFEPIPVWCVTPPARFVDAEDASWFKNALANSCKSRFDLSDFDLTYPFDILSPSQPVMRMVETAAAVLHSSFWCSPKMLQLSL